MSEDGGSKKSFGSALYGFKFLHAQPTDTPFGPCLAFCPLRIITKVKSLAKNILKKFGYELNRNETVPTATISPHLNKFFRVLKKFQFDPKHIIDVGANHGMWTREAIRFFPSAQYTLVEPQAELKQDVADLIAKGHKINWISAGAGAKDGTALFTYANEDDACTFSLTPEQAQKVGWTRQTELEIKTLNSIVASSGLPMPDMVKIDAEGIDLEVLAGASNLIGKTEIFLLEAAVCAGRLENTVLEVLRQMDERGYRLMEITDLNRTPKDNILWLTELAFVKKGSALLKNIKSYH
jgi:FkbM family methyltransferase